MDKKTIVLAFCSVLQAISSFANITPVAPEDPRVSRKFAALGSMFQIDNFILSGDGGHVYFDDAKSFCSERDALIPTALQWEAIAKAMGKDTAKGYDGSLTAMLDDFYWMSSGVIIGDVRADKLFWGAEGDIHILDDYDSQRIRCVKVIE